MTSYGDSSLIAGGLAPPQARIVICSRTTRTSRRDFAQPIRRLRVGSVGLQHEKHEEHEEHEEHEKNSWRAKRAYSTPQRLLGTFVLFVLLVFNRTPTGSSASGT